MDLPTYDELEKTPSALPVQQSRPAVENFNSNKFGSPANSNQQQQQYLYPTLTLNEQQYQYPTEPQYNPEFKFQYPQQQQQQGIQPMIPLEMVGQTLNTNPNPKSAPIHPSTNGQPDQRSFVLQMLTSGAIIVKLIYAIVVLGLFMEWENSNKAQNESRNVVLDPVVEATRGFTFMMLGFSVVHIALLFAVFFGAVKRNLYLVLVWIVLLCLDTVLQLFVLGATSIMFDTCVTNNSNADKTRNYFIFLLVQSVLFLTVNVPFLICALLFCKQLHSEKSRPPQAKIMPSQPVEGHTTFYSS